jgi:predicted molibdopterin-dependent oxidoreductase YjgC
MGGNLLAASHRPKMVNSALGQVSIRVHQGTSFNPSMLIEPGELTIILPSQNRYEQRGGGTHTSVDRRIRMSPEIEDHPHIGDSRPAWQIPCQIAVRAQPEIAHALGYAGAQDIRNEMGRTMSKYAGIERLGAKHNQMQWGGVQRSVGGFPNMLDGRACFTSFVPPKSSLQSGEWILTPRWVETSENIPPHIWMDSDLKPGRDELYIHPDDIEQLGLQDGSHVRIHNEHGEWFARLLSAAIKPGMVQAHWPECQAIVPCSIESQSNHSEGSVAVSIESR